MIEIILTIASVISASGIVGAIAAWFGSAFTSYINERDKLRDQILSLKAQAASQDATIVALQEQVLAQVRVTDQQEATITKQDVTIARLEETVTKLEATIKELTRDKAAAERERDAALRGDEPETGEHSAAPADDLGGVSIPKLKGASE